MRVDFLSAADATPLTKTYTRAGATWETSAYPMVRDFHSRSADVATPDDFYTQLIAHSPTHCVLKGQLSRPLVNESRAGLTLADQPTDWLLLDYDADTGFNSVDEMLAAIDPELADTTYIWQHSSSSGLRETSKLRGHAFILLDQPARPGVIKEWLKACNLRVPALRDLIELSASGFAVRWPLDTTTCQSDKLIYITPPNVRGEEDPLKGKRFELVTRAKPRAAIDFSTNPAQTQTQTDELIAELRKKAGLKKISARYRAHGAVQLLTNPDRAVVTGERHQRGFVYLNLNHGDSWAYYFPEGDPEVLFNFKGEPPCRLQAICPDYYAAYLSTITPEEPQTTPVVFRDPETDSYYNGLYRTKPEELTLYPVGSVQKIEHFLAQYGHPPPDFILDWTVRFDPTTLEVINFEKRWANLFSPTPYLREAPEAPPAEAVPRVIERVLRSVTVDDETYHHFVNWLAYIFQTREKTGTAWLFHGVPGTGKGVLFSRILQPLLGRKYTNIYTTQTIEEMFNAGLEQELITFIDEFKIDDGGHASKLMNKIKNLITEPTALIRGMRRNPVQRRVYNNVIMATNHEDAAPIEEKDRRINVAPRQATPLLLTAEDVDHIHDELPQFAAFLQQYSCDARAVRTTLKNAARELAIAASETSVNRFFRAVREGDFDYFLEFAMDTTSSAAPDLPQIQYQKIVRDWAKRLADAPRASRDELRTAYRYLQGNQLSASKFSRMCKIHGVEITPMRIGNEQVRGVYTPMTSSSPDEVAAFLAREGEPHLSAVRN